MLLLYYICFFRCNYQEDLHFKEQVKGKKGFIQLFSIIPTSYPGHNILTEDLGEIVDNSKCICANRGKAFFLFTEECRNQR